MGSGNLIVPNTRGLTSRERGRRVRGGSIGAACWAHHLPDRNAVASPPSQSSVHVGIIAIPTGRRTGELPRFAVVTSCFTLITPRCPGLIEPANVHRLVPLVTDIMVRQRPASNR